MSIDQHSATWKSVEAWAEEKINECQATLELTPNHHQVLKLQGEIAAYRDLLALVHPPQVVSKNIDYF